MYKKSEIHDDDHDDHDDHDDGNDSYDDGDGKNATKNETKARAIGRDPANGRKCNMCNGKRPDNLTGLLK